MGKWQLQGLTRRFGIQLLPNHITVPPSYTNEQPASLVSFARGFPSCIKVALLHILTFRSKFYFLIVLFSLFLVVASLIAVRRELL